MKYSKPEPTKELHQRLNAKRPYHAPRLEILGSLRSATRGTGPVNGDGGQNMMAPPGRAG
jgi:hypothetical protein